MDSGFIGIIPDAQTIDFAGFVGHIITELTLCSIRIRKTGGFLWLDMSFYCKKFGSAQRSI